MAHITSMLPNESSMTDWSGLSNLTYSTAYAEAISVVPPSVKLRSVIRRTWSEYCRKRLVTNENREIFGSKGEGDRYQVYRFVSTGRIFYDLITDICQVNVDGEMAQLTPPASNMV